ncbi:MAG: GvpL/GvpF family gas vesicle protein [Candidatus Marinimicrobia bacterium]|nr:GvpL/GvpF family gas vesicle protein [Candidatus Neomarinimicrobiota bacterium]
MQRDGKYIYCIISTKYDTNFGPIGVGGRCDLVSTIGFDGLCMVVSDHPLGKFVVSPDNIISHQKVLEAVMKEFESMLPIRFGTIAATPDEIRNLLNRRYSEFMELLKQFENKVEINVKGIWRDMSMIYKEIDKEHAELHNSKVKIEKMPDLEKRKLKIVETGELIEHALAEKKVVEAEKIIDAFRRSVFDYRHNKTSGDAMFMNTAILMNSGRGIELDNMMADLGIKYQDRSDFVYTAPLPIYNFIDLKIFPEKWEL